MTPERIRELAEQATDKVFEGKEDGYAVIERAIRAALVECLSEPASQAMIAAAYQHEDALAKEQHRFAQPENYWGRMAAVRRREFEGQG